MTEAEWDRCDEPRPLLDHLRATLAGGADGVLRAWVHACRVAAGGHNESEDAEHCANWWADPGNPNSPNYFSLPLPMPDRASLLRDVAGNVFWPVTLPWRCRECSIPCGPPTAGYYCVRCGSDEARCSFLTPDVVAVAHAARDHADERGLLDATRLAILADALEEAGCDGEPCNKCSGSGTYSVRVRNAALSAANGYGPATTYSEWRGCRHCGGEWDKRGTGKIPHPLLAHLRGPGVHCAGCWGVGLVLGG